MDRSSNASPEPRRPSAVDGLQGHAQMGLGAAIAVMGVTTVALGGVVAGLPILIFGSLIAGTGVAARTAGTSGRVVDAAFAAMLRGRIQEAEALLALAETHWQPASVRRAMDLLRGELALRRGDFRGALARTDAILRRATSVTGSVTRGVTGGTGTTDERQQVAAALALRALARVSIGDNDGAKVDLAALDAMPEAPPGALGRAAVAQALLLEGTGEREALGALLRGPAARLSDAIAPRERALLRGFRRMLDASRSSVYRAAVASEVDAQAPSGAALARSSTLAPDMTHATDWIAAIAPAAAPFVRRVARIAPPPEATPNPPGVPSPADMAAQTQASSMLFWTLCIGFFAGAWKMLRFSGHRFPEQISIEIAAVAVAILIALVASTRRRAFADDELAVAVSSLARGEASALEKLKVLAKLDDVVTAARAWLALAKHATKHAELDQAARYVIEGLALVDRDSATRGVAIGAGIWPELVSEHAWIAALRGEGEAAGRALDLLYAETPEDPYLLRTELRVLVLKELREGDFIAAAGRAAAAPEALPLTVNEEILLEVVTAVAHPRRVGAAETERLRREVVADPTLSRWLSYVAPELMHAFAGSRDEPATRRSAEEIAAAGVDQLAELAELAERDKQATNKAEEDAQAEQEALDAADVPARYLLVDR